MQLQCTLVTTEINNTTVSHQNSCGIVMDLIIKHSLSSAVRTCLSTQDRKHRLMISCQRSNKPIGDDACLDRCDCDGQKCCGDQICEIETKISLNTHVLLLLPYIGRAF